MPPQPIQPHGLEAASASVVRRLVESFLARRSAETAKAYRQDLEDFRSFVAVRCGRPFTAEEAAGLLLGGGHGAANALALEYRGDLIRRELAAATVNRRLASLRSLVRLANTLGVVPWALEVGNERAEAYRDTRGPGRGGFRRLLDGLEGRADGKGLRDRAILRLLFDLALRRAEVTRLDVEDLDLQAGTLAVLGKGRTAKALLTLPGPTRQTLAAWLEARGPAPGPLFVSFDRAGNAGRRLTGRGLYKVVRGLGDRTGVAARPHGLRHAAITAALDLTNGDVRAVQKFSRHANPQVLLRYDDNRTDLAGQVAERVARGA